MDKTIVEKGAVKIFELEHKELRMFINSTNLTMQEEARFESESGCFCKDKECWIFPSPLDAIKVFQSL